ncbi:hypothetical protein CAPTEDRAFT_214920 [Capitella teleta]|uniref:Retrotransposon gag domain-containing protein n=1 Tax=Capitella teleta TaxID=283909 RepID=R7UUP0_CAPTE|nr:hypothetical protein CAPTEDRAFT_214920 [Capitella teleta]|eukprot:ELU07076.1 hypothetical protein CAPTEDRAFT_214920 [Capitella teleta]
MDQEAALQTQAEIAARNERRQIILTEINKVTKCDGSDPTLVRQWIQEIQLARGLPDNAAAIELISGSTCGAFKLELEAFLAQQPNRDAVLWEDIRTHLLQCFVSADHAEFHRGLLTKVFGFDEGQQNMWRAHKFLTEYNETQKAKYKKKEPAGAKALQPSVFVSVRNRNPSKGEPKWQQQPHMMKLTPCPPKKQRARETDLLIMTSPLALPNEPTVLTPTGTSRGEDPAAGNR